MYEMSEYHGEKESPRGLIFSIDIDLTSGYTRLTFEVIWSHKRSSVGEMCHFGWNKVR